MRQPISEYRAKSVVNAHLGIPYSGIQIHNQPSDLKKIIQLDSKTKYVIKVDQGIKKRGQNGLITTNASPRQLLAAWKKFTHQGYSQFLIEPFILHSPAQEHYLSLDRQREGIRVLYSGHGGVNIESQSNQIKHTIIPYRNNTQKITQPANHLQIKTEIVTKLLDAFNQNYFSFMEVNPFILTKYKIHFLDCAVEVDTAGEFFVNRQWTTQDFVFGQPTQKTPEEININQLANNSQASFKFDLINPQGSIWMLLSGGGASIVLADEIYNLGYTNLLANYGEYSGNPNDEETYIYTHNLLSLLLKSPAKQKILIIAGGVANFTDIRATFKGIITALEENKVKLISQRLKVYVRRGGPYQTQGLSNIAAFLTQSRLYGQVSGPELPLTNIIKLATKSLKLKNQYNNVTI